MERGRLFGDESFTSRLYNRLLWSGIESDEELKKKLEDGVIVRDLGNGAIEILEGYFGKKIDKLRVLKFAPERRQRSNDTATGD